MKPFFAFSSAPIRVLLGTTAALGLFACDPDSDPDPTQPIAATKTVFVVNEGNFMKSNAEISSFSKTTALVSKSLFSAINNRPLGDVAQSMAAQDSTGYIVVNNSNKLEVVNLRTFRSLATISNLKLPRYFAAASANKGYVTETVSYSGVPGQVSIVDLKTNTVTKSISVGKQPETLLVVGNRLYVANGGENTVTVINTTTDVVEGTITVGDSPNSLVLDRNNKLWVLNGGKVVYDASYNVDYTKTTKGSLSSITPGQLTATTRELATNLSQPGRLTTNGPKDKLYYTFQSGVYTLGINDAKLPTTPIIKRSLYGLGIDPQDNTIYGGVSNSFSGAGQVVRYQSTGARIDSFNVSVGPNSFLFY
ncbi:YncE family protein [Hymenobacter volaticus]|uniref:YncE family protein n=1 Tax=Hymenobacter volaticus TaxID=2932254 RepID=A0ABY4G4Z9_9BACT|nr:DUF5074 domain-containing protein [Hymenobacter volaticus]UOQ65704.1 hypothetical protein MUN86_19560 [Hymenobacter volaticus]